MGLLMALFSVTNFLSQLLGPAKGGYKVMVAHLRPVH